MQLLHLSPEYSGQQASICSLSPWSDSGMSCLHCAAPRFHYWLARCLTAVQILQTQDSKRYHMQLVRHSCKCVRYSCTKKIHTFSSMSRKQESTASTLRNADSERLWDLFFQSGCKPLQSPTNAPHPPHKLSICILSTLHIHINTWGHHQILQGSQDQVLWSSWSWIFLPLWEGSCFGVLLRPQKGMNGMGDK